jgi:hypothetical protein
MLILRVLCSHCSHAALILRLTLHVYCILTPLSTCCIGTCGGAGSATITLQKCTAGNKKQTHNSAHAVLPPPTISILCSCCTPPALQGNKKQTWAFGKDGKSIASGGLCIDINNFKVMLTLAACAHCTHFYAIAPLLISPYPYPPPIPPPPPPHPHPTPPHHPHPPPRPTPPRPPAPPRPPRPAPFAITPDQEGVRDMGLPLRPRV